MALDIEIGRIGIWGSAPGWQEAADAAEAAAELEQLGYGALWLGRSESDVEPHRSLIAATERLVLATGIVNIWTNPPSAIAATYSEVEREHPGRLVIGLGSSHAPIVERVTAQKYEKPVTRLAQYLDELDAVVETVPRGRRVLAALGPRALKLSAERSAGAHPYLVTPEHTRRARETIGPEALLAPEQTVVLDSDPESARAKGRQMIQYYLELPNYTNNFQREGFTEDDLKDGGSDRLIDAIIAWGDAGTVAARIAEHHEAGADHVAIQIFTGREGLPREEWRALAGALSP